MSGLDPSDRPAIDLASVDLTDPDEVAGDNTRLLQVGLVVVPEARRRAST